MELNLCRLCSFLFALLLTIGGPFIESVQGFQCRYCSYFKDKGKIDGPPACIDKPFVFTQNNLLNCKNYCAVREVFNVQTNEIMSYWRSCVEDPAVENELGDSAVCSGTDVITCMYTCRGDKCTDWVKGDLHIKYMADSAFPMTSQNGGWLVLLALVTLAVFRMM